MPVGVSTEAGFGEARNSGTGDNVATGTFSELRRRFADAAPTGGQSYPCGTGKAAAVSASHHHQRGQGGRGAHSVYAVKPSARMWAAQLLRIARSSWVDRT